MPALVADVSPVYVSDHGPELKVYNAIRTPNGTIHLRAPSVKSEDLTPGQNLFSEWSKRLFA